MIRKGIGVRAEYIRLHTGTCIHVDKGGVRNSSWEIRKMVGSAESDRLGEDTADVRNRRRGPHREEILSNSETVVVKGSFDGRGRERSPQRQPREPLLADGEGLFRLTDGPPWYTYP